jgi:RNA polymerase sigma-70 factor (ECF subfamily)
MDGDARAVLEYSKFYREYSPRLVAFLTYLGFSPTDAADVAQETLMSLLPPVWETVTHRYGWCRRVAYRKACRLPATEVPSSPLNAADNPLIAPNADLEQVDELAELTYWLRKLKGEKQRAVLAWSFDGATPAETAAELDMDPSSVRSTLYQARRALRDLRAAEGGEQ